MRRRDRSIRNWLECWYRSLRASGAECKCRNPFRCRSSKGPADNGPAVLLGRPRFPSRHGGISSDRAGSFPIPAVPVVDGGGVRGIVEVWERTLWRGVGGCMRGAVSPGRAPEQLRWVCYHMIGCVPEASVRQSYTAVIKQAGQPGDRAD